MFNYIFKKYYLLWKLHFIFLWLSSLAGKKITPSRVACLGKDVFQNCALVNKQKLRLDVFLNQLGNKNLPTYQRISPYILRNDILPMMVQQCTHPWSKNLIKSSQFFVIDSYSELTDQEFRHRKTGWSFCANYNDINHYSDFDTHFESLGLLPLNRIEDTYKEFFNWLRSINPKITIVFIHFPTTLDQREKFQERGEMINLAIKKLGLENFYDIRVNENLVKSNQSDDFPYHFSDFTKNHFIKQLKKIPNFKI